MPQKIYWIDLVLESWDFRSLYTNCVLLISYIDEKKGERKTECPFETAYLAEIENFLLKV